MKRFSQRSRGGMVLAELNITPLLDLCFVLLIIFMITTPLMEQSLDINLPSAQPSLDYRPPPADRVMNVNIDGAGVISVGREQLNSLGELETRLASEMQRNPKTVVALRADKELRYRQLMDVLDIVRRSGAQLGLANIPEER